jgi:hypothetical protein
MENIIRAFTRSNNNIHVKKILKEHRTDKETFVLGKKIVDFV